MLSSNPLDILAPWTCEVCNRSIPSKFMKFGNITIHEEIDRLDKSSPAAIEKFLSKYEKILHPTNAHVIRVKFDLMQIYGTVSGYSYSGMNLINLILYQSFVLFVLQIVGLKFLTS